MSADNCVQVVEFTDGYRVKGNESCSFWCEIEDVLRGEEDYYSIAQLQKILWDTFGSRVIYPDLESAKAEGHKLYHAHYHEYGVGVTKVPFPCEDPGDIEMPEWYDD